MADVNTIIKSLEANKKFANNLSSDELEDLMKEFDNYEIK